MHIYFISVWIHVSSSQQMFGTRQKSSNDFPEQISSAIMIGQAMQTVFQKFGIVIEMRILNIFRQKCVLCKTLIRQDLINSRHHNFKYTDCKLRPIVIINHLLSYIQSAHRPSDPMCLGFTSCQWPITCHSFFFFSELFTSLSSSVWVTVIFCYLYLRII